MIKKFKIPIILLFIFHSIYFFIAVYGPWLTGTVTDNMWKPIMFGVSIVLTFLAYGIGKDYEVF